MNWCASEGEKDRRQIETIHGAEVYRRRGKLLPLAYLSQVLGLPSDHGKDPLGIMNIVVVQAEETAFGLVVDQVNDTQEIVVKALGKQLKALSCYVGATIMGDGKIALILDVTGIAKLAHLLAQPLKRGRTEGRPAAETVEKKQMLLLFRSGKFPRLVLPLSLVARLEEFPVSRIEYAAGAPVLRYRDAILPLIWLSGLLDPEAATPSLVASPRADREGMPEGKLDSLQVIVFTEDGRYVGIVVDEILDIVDDAVTIRRPSVAFGLLGSGVVGGKVTDFVDLGALLGAAKESSAGVLASAAGTGRNLLLVDGARMARGVLRSFLEIHGHHVSEAATAEEAIEVLEHMPIHTPVEVVLSSLRASGGTGASGKLQRDSSSGSLNDSLNDSQGCSHTDPLMRWLSKRSGPSIPVLALVDDGNAAGAEPNRLHSRVRVDVRDRAALLLGIENLAAQAASQRVSPELVAMEVA